MTTRTEPNIAIQGGSITRGKSWFAKPEVSHTDLLNDALDGFTAAQEKMATAIATIASSIADDEAQAAALARSVSEKRESMSRLDRVKERLEGLLS